MWYGLWVWSAPGTVTKGPDKCGTKGGLGLPTAPGAMHLGGGPLPRALWLCILLASCRSWARLALAARAGPAFRPQATQATRGWGTFAGGKDGEAWG